MKQSEGGGDEEARSKPGELVGVMVGEAAGDREEDDMEIESETPMLHVVEIESCKPPRYLLHCGSQCSEGA